MFVLENLLCGEYWLSDSHDRLDNPRHMVVCLSTEAARAEGSQRVQLRHHRPQANLACHSRNSILAADISLFCGLFSFGGWVEHDR